MIKHISQEQLTHVIRAMARASHNDWEDETRLRAMGAVRDLGLEGALEFEALMYFGRGDYDSLEQAYTAMSKNADWTADGAAGQVIGKQTVALEYIAVGLAKLASAPEN